MLARWLLRVIVFTSCLLCASLTLVAQEKGQIGVFGGGSWYYGANFRSSYPETNTLTPYKFVPGGRVGVRVREMLTEHFGLEQSITSRQQQHPFGPISWVLEPISSMPTPTGMVTKEILEFGLTLALVRGLICFVRLTSSVRMLRVRTIPPG